MLLIAALGSPAIMAFVVWPWPEQQVLPNLLSLVAQVLTNRAWTYLAWVAFRGWAVRSRMWVGDSLHWSAPATSR